LGHGKGEGYLRLDCPSPFLNEGKSRVHRMEDQGGKATGNIRAVLKSHTAELMRMEGVVGCGIGEYEGELCIRLFVVEKTPSVVGNLPDEIDGFKVILVETGQVVALDREPEE